jgi:cytochrome c oxidase subunit II
VPVAGLALTACAQQPSRGWMPDGGVAGEVTSHTGLITQLWVGSWIAALLVGALVWGLTMWCVVAYRRRKEDTGLPAQLRYNVPIEVLYTLVPLFMIAVLFFYTARDQATIESREAEPDTTIQVIGKQWSWDFNYVDEDVFETGVQVPINTPGEARDTPVLYLPVGETVRLQLNARDVIHSFWVPAFLYKKDMIPGRTNYYQFEPQETGEFVGKCAELCGEFHSEMLFAVRVVERAEYDEYIQSLRDAGQEGQLDLQELSRVVTEEDAPAEGAIGGEGTDGGNN